MIWIIESSGIILTARSPQPSLTGGGCFLAPAGFGSVRGGRHRSQWTAIFITVYAIPYDRTAILPFLLAHILYFRPSYSSLSS